MVELKTVKALDDLHIKASRLRFYLLLNFGKPCPEIKRVADGL